MTNEIDSAQFCEGQTPEDFANAVASALQDGKNVARIAFEDFKIPDALVMQASTTIQGHTLTYRELFFGALKYFHQLEPSSARAIPTPGKQSMAPYSMSLEMSFSEQANAEN